MRDNFLTKVIPLCYANYIQKSNTVFRVIKSRRMRWTGHVALMGSITVFWWGNLRERDYLGDPGVDGRTILRRIFRKWDVGGWIVSIWLTIGTGGGHL
jgi:hypothetical protein